MNIADARHLDLINDGMGFLHREAAIMDHPRVAQLHREMAAKAEPVQPSYATHGLPDPNLIGPCQSQSSPFCEPDNGRQRMDPMDMAETETAFRGYLDMCQPCYDSQADLYVRYTHGRD